MITLDVPDDMEGVGPWSAEQCLLSYISHWLEEDYFAQDHIVELPSGIQYEGYELLPIEETSHES